ncbi:heparan sulfate 2-O-sulfotransferase 1-like isoform X2 [Convolutriloba macropyga]|uniref:heparan sulfate 2-O-sulfotransferase 1-like isoform X2 n=1 Tax=Convolutriloba macropyga TaxID=536237 RepID=UPI003F5244C6
MIGTRYVLRFVMLIIFCTSMMFYTKLTGLLSLQLNVRSFDDQSILPSEYNLRGVESAGMIHRVIKDQSSPSSSLSYQSQSSWSRDHAREEPIRVLVYNRVPKTGSTTIANLFYESAPANGVSVLIANFSKVAGMVSLQDQMKFVHNISTWTSIHPVIVHGHFPYLNFHRFGAGDSSVVHVSMVREPLDRLVSSYYFKRYGDTFHGDKRHSKYRDTTTFDECVSQNLSECSSDALWFQIPYFCGSSPFCRPLLSSRPWFYDLQKMFPLVLQLELLYDPKSASIGLVLLTNSSCGAIG